MTGEVQRLSASGRGITASPHPSVTAGQSVDAAGGCARETAGSGPVFGAVAWRTCQNADVQRDGETRLPTGCLV